MSATEVLIEKIRCERWSRRSSAKPDAQRAAARGPSRQPPAVRRGGEVFIY